MSDGKTNENRDDDYWGEAVYSYSRKQAIEDGVLIEVPREALRIAKIRLPLAITRTLWLRCISDDVLGEGESFTDMVNDATHRLAAMLVVFHNAVQTPGRARGARMTLCLPDLDEKPVKVIAHCGPGDTPEPVLTFMLPEDD